MGIQHTDALLRFWPSVVICCFLSRHRKCCVYIAECIMMLSVKDVAAVFELQQEKIVLLSAFLCGRHMRLRGTF